MTKNPFRYFKTSPEIIQLAVMMYVRFPLSLRNVEDLLHERGIDVCHESVRLWVDRFGTHFASKIRKQRASYMRQVTQWQWHLDEVFVKINGVQHYLWRAVDHEGEVYRNSPPCIHQHTIISTINAISRPEPDLNNYETPPYSNGASWSLPKTCCLTNFGDWFALH